VRIERDFVLVTSLDQGTAD